MDQFLTNIMISPGEYNLQTLTITSYNGLSVDVRNNVIELTLHEDMYCNFVCGELLIGENVNLIRHLPLIGNELIEVEIITPSRKIPIKQTFFVYKIADKTDLDPSYKSNVYTIYFCSLAYMKAQQTKISRSFANMSYADMVKSIFNDYLKDPKPLLTQETLGKKQLVIPFMNPLDAINMIAKRSISDDGKDFSYLFYETFNSFEFSTINYLAKNQPEPTLTYQYFQANTTREDQLFKELNSDIKRIEKYDVLTLNNTLKNVREGVFASRLLTHDITTKKYQYTDFSYTDDYPQMTTLHPNGILPPNDNEYGAHPFSHFRYYPKHSYLFSDVENTDEYENHVLKRNAHLTHFDTFRLSILAAGDSNRRVGEIINVNIFSGEARQNLNDNPFDYYLSGKYLITKITHILQKESYKMRMQLERDSIPHPYPDRKVWSSS